MGGKTWVFRKVLHKQPSATFSSHLLPGLQSIQTVEKHRVNLMASLMALSCPKGIKSLE